jgi:inorganic pyrophosphatase
MLDQLPAWEHETGRLRVVIETPRGSRNKYDYDPEIGQLRIDKVLPLGTAFPYDFGFVPSTRAEDGDPLDVLVLLDEPAFPGCVLTTRLIGVIEAKQTDKNGTIRNDRLIAVLDTKRNPATIHSLKDLDPKRLDELERFFIAYNEEEGRKFKPLGRHGPKKAEKLVIEAMLDRPLDGKVSKD